MDDDLKPNNRNFTFWCPEGAFMLSKLAVLRLRDKLVNEGPALDVGSALSAAADAIEEIEVAWKAAAGR